MKAVVYVGDRKIEVREIPMPTTPPDEILVKIEYCALCATDVHLVNNGLFGVDQPLIVGHEMSGTV
ncbi:MAG: alcohol dehydrogenase catalytic domain-containing protein, partial [Lachnospiraceae bacterium]|nr:alcohol dehydrogenase catalytic domain-containing protein [Lachnospiraceae bacterium]